MKTIVWELPSGKHIVEIFCLILGRRSQTSKGQWGWEPDQSAIGANINPNNHHHPHPQPHHRHHPQHHHYYNDQVARVCKSDVGGTRSLNAKWTSFLKARHL